MYKLRGPQLAAAQGGWVLLSALAVILLVSSVSVVYVQHTRRELYAELRDLERERDKLQVHWGQLRIQHSTMAAPETVQERAESELKLYAPAPDQVNLIRREFVVPNTRLGPNSARAEP